MEIFPRVDDSLLVCAFFPSFLSHLASNYANLMGFTLCKTRAIEQYPPLQR